MMRSFQKIPSVIKQFILESRILLYLGVIIIFIGFMILDEKMAGRVMILLSILSFVREWVVEEKRKEQ